MQLHTAEIYTGNYFKFIQHNLINVTCFINTLIFNKSSRPFCLKHKFNIIFLIFATYDNRGMNRENCFRQFKMLMKFTMRKIKENILRDSAISFCVLLNISDKVAIKIIEKSKLDAKTRKMLTREIATMETIHHSNIIR